MNRYVPTIDGRQVGQYTAVFPGPRADSCANPYGTITFRVVEGVNLVRPEGKA